MTQRESFVERVVRRVEDHVQEWRERERLRKQETEEVRQELWREAAERERLLAEAIDGEDRPPQEVSGEQQIVFVVHSDETGRRLESFAGAEACLVRVFPGRASYPGEDDLKVSWLVFEQRR